MKMKTERGRRKTGRRLGLPEVKQKQAVRHVSLHPPVERGALAPRPETPDLEGEAQPGDERPAVEETAEANEEEGPRLPEDEQP